jgi:hypothetical protein
MICSECYHMLATEYFIINRGLITNVTLSIATINGRLVMDITLFLYIYIFLTNERFISHNLLLCRPSQKSVRSQVPSQVATHQTIGSQLWAGEMPGFEPGIAGQQSVALPLSHHASTTLHSTYNNDLVIGLS